MRQRGALLHADELRMCPEPKRAGRTEDVVTDPELVDGCAHGFDLSRQFGAEDPLLWSAEAREEAADERLACTNRAVGPSDRRGVHLDEYFVLLGDGLLDVVESQDIGCAVPVKDNGSHWSRTSLSQTCSRG